MAVVATLVSSGGAERRPPPPYALRNRNEPRHRNRITLPLHTETIFRIGLTMEDLCWKDDHAYERNGSGDLGTVRP